MTTLPHNFKRIRLNLARSKEFPQGSARHGYEFVAPLKADGPHRRDAMEEGPRAIAACAASGKARRTRSATSCTSRAGRSTRRWVFDYDQSARTTTRAAIASAPTLPPGEYVSIRDDDGDMHTYQVASVEAAT